MLPSSFIDDAQRQLPGPVKSNDNTLKIIRQRRARRRRIKNVYLKVRVASRSGSSLFFVMAISACSLIIFWKEASSSAVTPELPLPPLDGTEFAISFSVVPNLRRATNQLAYELEFPSQQVSLPARPPSYSSLLPALETIAPVSGEAMVVTTLGDASHAKRRQVSTCARLRLRHAPSSTCLLRWRCLN